MTKGVRSPRNVGKVGTVRTLRMSGRTLLLSLVLLVAPAGAASAQTANYPGNPPDGEVLGTGDQRGDAEVGGVVTARPASTARAAAGNNLAVTGGDVVQLGLIGVALVGGGVVLVKRSRRVAPTA